MRSEIKVRLTIKNFPMSPDELSQRLGLQPTTAWMKGQPKKLAKGSLYSFNNWELDSGLNNSESLENHLKALMGKIIPLQMNFTKVCPLYETTISCVIYSYEKDRPSIFFDKETVDLVAQLKASIDIDLYVM